MSGSRASGSVCWSRRTRFCDVRRRICRRRIFGLWWLPKMIYPLVEQLAAEGIPVAATCGVLGFARQPFYRWRHRPVGERVWVQAHRINALVDAHRDDPQFEYRFLAKEARKKGWRMSRRTAWA